MKLSRRIGLGFLVVFCVLVAGTMPVFAVYVDNGNGTVTDNTTKLIWQKAEDGTTRSMANATAYCQNLVLGGYSDWRLPRIDELATIVDYSRYPTIDPAFAALKGMEFWSSSNMAMDPTRRGWLVGFYDGTVFTYSKTSVYYTRCVRGGPFWSFDPVEHLTVSSSNTVTDTYRNNMWQRKDDSVLRTWADAKSYCENLSLDGYTDWRLPSASELQTIIDYATYSPSLSTEVFNVTSLPIRFWSATGNVRYAAGTYAMYIDPQYSSTSIASVASKGYVLCVRSGAHLLQRAIPSRARSRPAAGLPWREQPWR